MKKFLFSFATVCSALCMFVCAETEAGASGGSEGSIWASLSSLLIPIGLLVLMYFFLIRPQKKQEKEIASMRDNLVVGDEISTNGGLIGRIIKINDDIITIETGSDKTRLKVFRWAIRKVEVPFEAETDDEK